jgi:hypothetical protein
VELSISRLQLRPEEEAPSLLQLAIVQVLLGVLLLLVEVQHQAVQMRVVKPCLQEDYLAQMLVELLLWLVEVVTQLVGPLLLLGVLAQLLVVELSLWLEALALRVVVVM